MSTLLQMAHEAAGDDWGLFQEFMPEIERLAELVRADEREKLAKFADQYMRDCEGKSFGVANAIRARSNT